VSSPLAAELLATFGLVFFGTGAVVTEAGRLGVGLVFGFVVVHMNPAVSIALLGRKAGPHVAAQLAGAALASLVLKVLFPQSASLGATVPAGPVWQSFVLELVMTYFLMRTVLGGDVHAIGLVVAVEAIMGGPVSGASMNPARSFGPALLSGAWTAHWVYWTAPIAGALLASALPGAGSRHGRPLPAPAAPAA